MVSISQRWCGFLSKLIQDFQLDHTIYQQSGTLLLRPEKQIAELRALAEERKKRTRNRYDQAADWRTDTASTLPKPLPALKISGGGRLDGKAYLIRMRKLAQDSGVKFISQRVQLANIQSLTYGNNQAAFDQIILTVGPHLKGLLAPLNYQVDLRPQRAALSI